MTYRELTESVSKVTTRHESSSETCSSGLVVQLSRTPKVEAGDDDDDKHPVERES